MTLAEILNTANKGYPDEFLSNYYDDETGEPVKGSGDTLAQFIVTELRETFDADSKPDNQLAVAVGQMESAIRDLQGVIDALEGGAA